MRVREVFGTVRRLSSTIVQLACVGAAGAITLSALPELAESASLGAGGAAGGTAHVMKKGETIDQLAKKYGVTVKAILQASKLKDPSAIKTGTKLMIPPKSGSSAAGGSKAQSYELKPKVAGRASFTRLGTHETFALQLVKKGKLVPGILPRMSKLMRFGPSGLEHPIEPRLVAQLAQVSDHFGGRTFEIISGYRPKMPKQYTAHSNHNLGRAMDFRIPGVPNEVLRDYCRTFKQSGVGYYPNSMFIHFDVRSESAYWIDLSRAGEPPRYVTESGVPVKHDADADHAADDSATDMDTPKDEAPAAATSVGAPSVTAAPSSAPASATSAAPAPAASTSAH